MRQRYRVLVKLRHPDRGGTAEQFRELERAWKEASGADLYESFDPFGN